MPFDVGSIIGKLGWDVSGLVSAYEVVRQLGSQINDVVENSMGQAFEDLTRTAQECGEGIGQAFVTAVGSLGGSAQAIEGSFDGMGGEGEANAELISSAMSEMSRSAEDAASSINDSAGQMASSFAEAGNAAEGAGAALGGEGGGEGGGSFVGGILQAQGLMELLPEWLAVGIEDPLLGAALAAKEFSEAIAEAFQEAFTEVAGSAADLALLSEKTGTSIQFMSQWAGVASTVGISADELGMGFRKLQQVAAEAADGNKQSEESFRRIGISTEELKNHLSDTAWLFEHIKDGLDALPTSAQRVDEAQRLLGRGGNELIPIFLMQKQHIQDLMATQQQLGAVTDASEGQAGLAWKQFGAQVQQALEGIEKAATKPVLDFFAAHSQEIGNLIVGVTQWIEAEFGKLWAALESPAAQAAVQALKANVLPVIQEIAQTIGSEFDWVIAEVDKLFQFLGSPSGQQAIKVFSGDMLVLADLGAEVAKVLEWCVDGVEKLVHVMNSDAHVLTDAFKMLGKGAELGMDFVTGGDTKGDMKRIGDLGRDAGNYFTHPYGSYQDVPRTQASLGQAWTHFNNDGSSAAEQQQANSWFQNLISPHSVAGASPQSAPPSPSPSSSGFDPRALMDQFNSPGSFLSQLEPIATWAAPFWGGAGNTAAGAIPATQPSAASSDATSDGSGVSPLFIGSMKLALPEGFTQMESSALGDLIKSEALKGRAHHVSSMNRAARHALVAAATGAAH